MDLIKDKLEASGGIMVDSVRYDPKTSDFTPSLDDLSGNIDNRKKWPLKK